MNALHKNVYFIYSDIAEANPNYPCSMSATPNSICGMQEAYTLLHTYVFARKCFKLVYSAKSKNYLEVKVGGH